MEIKNLFRDEKDINMLQLCHTDPKLANDIIKNPSIYKHILSRRVKGFPNFKSELISSSHINQLIQISGTIVRSGMVLLKNVETEYICTKCSEVSFDKDTCSNCGFANLTERKSFENSTSMQSIKIQNIGRSAISEGIEVYLNEDSAGKFFPGENIVVTGTIRLKLNRMNVTINPSIFIEAINICLVNRNVIFDTNQVDLLRIKSVSPYERRREIINSFCPRIIGLYGIKLGLLLSITKAGQKTKRDSIHVLLVGQPATGKTFLMNGCVKLAYPAIITNGVGTTEAGLTTCAVKQGKEWSLEAGALILADKGICCIEEIDSLKTSDRAGLLEVMEQQTLSIAKAGLMSTLKARCSVISTLNCKYKYITIEDLNKANRLGSPLLSRFDLIFQNYDLRINDQDICESVLNPDTSDESVLKNSWLKSYISLVSTHVNEFIDEPVLAVNYFNYKRRQSRSEFVSIRMLEAILRLSEAHSKLVFNTEVTEDDVVSAIMLMECTLGAEKIVEFDENMVFMDEQVFKTVKSKLVTKLI